MDIHTKILLKEALVNAGASDISPEAYTAWGVLDWESFACLKDSSKIQKVGPFVWVYWRTDRNGERNYTVPHRIYIKNPGLSVTVYGR